MNPVREYQLRTRITAIISQAGQWLVRTPLHDASFEKYGRWSRWGKNHCFESHIDLEEFARRISVADGLEQKIYLCRVKGFSLNRSTLKLLE